MKRQSSISPSLRFFKARLLAQAQELQAAAENLGGHYRATLKLAADLQAEMAAEGFPADFDINELAEEEIVHQLVKCDPLPGGHRAAMAAPRRNFHGTLVEALAFIPRPEPDGPWGGRKSRPTGLDYNPLEMERSRS